MMCESDTLTATSSGQSNYRSQLSASFSWRQSYESRPEEISALLHGGLDVCVCVGV